MDQLIEKSGDFVDQKTGDSFTDNVDQAQDFAEGHTGDGDTAP